MMESSQLSKKLSRESAGSDDERETSPTRKSTKSKQKRKTSIKRRASKARQSMAPTGQEMSETLKYLKSLDRRGEESKIEQEEKRDEVADDLTKLTIEENESNDAQAAVAMQNRYSIGDFTSTMNEKVTFWSREPEKNVQLEDHLENDNEFDITGILNLSCMNVTDNDLPTVIQRAFWGGPKKCTGLILRDNALTADGVRMIVDTIIAGRACLKYLSFSSNPDIGDAGIEHIVRLLQQRRSLTFLALPGTGMTDHGVRLLADVLCGIDPDAPSPPPLEKLYISFNKGITDESAEALLQILEQNQRLKILAITHCNLSDKTFRRLKHVATKMKKKKFSLSG